MTQGIFLIVTFIVGCLLGNYFGTISTERDYQELLLAQAKKFEQQIKNYREMETKWERETYALEEEYKNRIDSINLSNDDLINGLRKQLGNTLSACRVSEVSKPASEPDGRTREARLSEELQRVIEESDKCSKRADELIIQLKSLQDWVNKVARGLND